MTELTSILNVGPKIAARLRGLGIETPRSCSSASPSWTAAVRIPASWT